MIYEIFSYHVYVCNNYYHIGIILFLINVFNMILISSACVAQHIDIVVICVARNVYAN